MEERTYTVYQIYNKAENKSYIGSTCHFMKRIRQHKNGKRDWQINFHDYPENWTVNILEDNISDINIKERELYYINLYDAINNGYNVRHAGNNTNLNTIQKMSESHKGIQFSEEHRIHISESQKCRHHSEETLEKMRKPKTEEHRRHISESHKGKSTWSKGKNLSEEHRKHISESHTGKNLSEEHRRHISEGMKKYLQNKKMLKVNIYENLRYL